MTEHELMIETAGLFWLTIASIYMVWMVGWLVVTGCKFLWSAVEYEVTGWLKAASYKMRGYGKCPECYGAGEHYGLGSYSLGKCNTCSGKGWIRKESRNNVTES